VQPNPEIPAQSRIPIPVADKKLNPVSVPTPVYIYNDFVDEFRCRDNSKCISNRSRCDNIQDCNDNSDEINCKMTKSIDIDCPSQLFTNTSGDIYSPNYPDSYPTNINCQWTIEQSPGARISLKVYLLE
jgi:hypothetical protein